MTASTISVVMLTFIVIATCGIDENVRAFSWAMAAVVAVVMLTVWLTGLAFGIEVRI